MGIGFGESPIAGRTFQAPTEKTRREPVQIDSRNTFLAIETNRFFSPMEHDVNMIQKCWSLDHWILIFLIVVLPEIRPRSYRNLRMQPKSTKHTFLDGLEFYDDV